MSDSDEKIEIAVDVEGGSLKIERGAWAAWPGESVFARGQLHVMVFEGVDGGTQVYVHHERNAYNPITAYAHYRGKGYDAERGVRKARGIFVIGA